MRDRPQAHQLAMKTSENTRRHRVLVLGASGLTGGAIAAALDQGAGDIEVVRAARNKQYVEAWRREGKEAVYLDLDNARTFPAALQGIDRLFVLTGYTIAMLHQSKTIVDAAAASGVNFIVHQGIFGDGRSTEPHFTWHEMIERYIGLRRNLGSPASELLHAEYSHHPRTCERPIALAYGR
jgi:NAD(P)H dehydrogenase (quinone)